MDFDRYLASELADHRAVAEATLDAVGDTFAVLAKTAVGTIRSGGKILLFGNGGSAADAQHIATELVIRYIGDRPPIAAIALTTDTSALTAGGNDLGFDRIFARQIEALARPGDLAIGFSTSGRSANVLAGLAEARVKGLATAGLTGRDGGALVDVADVVIRVPAAAANRIQEMHIVIGHALCGALEQALGLVEQ
ncbi:MAG: SIS domain-containing protein [Alphaproteobacteria bacterium]|nr:SIS domain-containing protein [Alphaproteobacteria bacterium]